MNSAQARRDPNEPSGSRTPVGATRKPRKKPKPSSSPLPYHPLLPPATNPSPQPVPQPYLALAPSPVSSLSQAAIDQRTGPSQSQLVLPSSYVRGQPSGSGGAGDGGGHSVVGGIGEPSGGGGGTGVSRPSTAAGQTQRKKKSARYAAGLLSPPAIVPGGSSATPRVQQPANISRRAAGTPTGGTRRGDITATPAGAMTRTTRLTDLSAINASLTSLGQLGQILESDPLPDEQAAEAAAAAAAGRAEQRAERRRRRIVRVEREGEGLSRRPTVTSREEGRALGLARSASMRRTNVWDDIPEGGIQEAGEPPPPFPFPTASTSRLPPAFGVPINQRSGSPISAGAGEDEHTRSWSPPPTWEQAVGLTPIPAPATLTPGADDPPTPRAGRPGPSALVPPRLVIPDASSRSRSRSSGRSASTRYESAPSSPIITPTRASPVEPSASTPTPAELPAAASASDPINAIPGDLSRSLAHSVLSATSAGDLAEDDVDVGGEGGPTEDERTDRRWWNADLLAGYTLEERVRREWGRRKAREDEYLRRRKEIKTAERGADVQEGNESRSSSEAVLDVRPAQGRESESMPDSAVAEGGPDINSTTVPELPDVPPPSKAQAMVPTPSDSVGLPSEEAQPEPASEQGKETEGQEAGGSAGALALAEVVPAAAVARGPSPSGPDEGMDKSLPQTPADKAPTAPAAGPLPSAPPAHQHPVELKSVKAVPSPPAQGGRKLRDKPKRQASTAALTGGVSQTPVIPVATPSPARARDAAVPAIALQPATPTPARPDPARSSRGDMPPKVKASRERVPASPLFKRAGWGSSSEVDKVGLGGGGKVVGNKEEDTEEKEKENEEQGQEIDMGGGNTMGQGGGRRLSEDEPRPPDSRLPPNREAALRRRELQLTPREPSASVSTASASGTLSTPNNPTDRGGPASKPVTSKPATSRPAASKPATSKPATSKHRPSPPRTKSTSAVSPNVSGAQVRKVRSLVAGPLIDLNDDSGSSVSGWSGLRGGQGYDVVEGRGRNEEEGHVLLEALAASTADLLQLLEQEETQAQETQTQETQAQETGSAPEARSVKQQEMGVSRGGDGEIAQEEEAQTSAQGAARFALTNPDTPRAASTLALAPPSVASSQSIASSKGERKIPPPPPPSRSKVALARARWEAQEREVEPPIRVREERGENSPQKRRPPPPPPPRHPSIVRASPRVPSPPSGTPSTVGESSATPPNLSLLGSSVSLVSTGETVQPPQAVETAPAPTLALTPTPPADKEKLSPRFGFFGMGIGKARPRGPRVPPPPPPPRNRRPWVTTPVEQPPPSEASLSTSALQQQQTPELAVSHPVPAASAPSPYQRPELAHAETTFEEADRLGIPSPLTLAPTASPSPVTGSSGPALMVRPLAERTQSDYPRLALVGRGLDGGDGRNEWRENEEARVNRSASEVDLRGDPGEGAGVAVSVAEAQATRRERERMAQEAQGYLAVGGRGEGSSDGAREERERASRRLEGNAGVGAGLHSRGGTVREREYTDVDLFVHRLEGSGREYEGFSHLTSFLGPSKPSSASPRAIAALLPGLIAVDSRRTTPQGKVKLKLSLLGVRVSKCPICLSQFKGGEKGVMTPECGHVAHQGCGLRWFREDGRCFVCREVLKEGDD